MRIAIDYGATSTKVVFLDNSKIKNKFSVRSESFSLAHLNFDNVEEIWATGGRSNYLPDKFEGVEIKKVEEIKAIAKAIKNLYGEDYIVVCAGTGTCIVNVKEEKHLGGTGVGGGTILGLGKLMLGINDFEKLEKLAKDGSAKNLDLSVYDIIGDDIGILSGNATASNFGKISKDRKKEDVAAAVFRLVGETVGVVSSFAFKTQKARKLLFTGTLMKSDYLKNIITETCKIFKIKPEFAKDPEYTVAKGILLKTKD